MPWTETTRAQYQREGLRYASDMTDAEWKLLQRLLPPPHRLGRPRKTDLRRVMEAVLYILSTGCQWRALPREVPPRDVPSRGLSPRNVLPRDVLLRDFPLRDVAPRTA